MNFDRKLKKKVTNLNIGLKKIKLLKYYLKKEILRINLLHCNHSLFLLSRHFLINSSTLS